MYCEYCGVVGVGLDCGVLVSVGCSGCWSVDGGDGWSLWYWYFCWRFGWICEFGCGVWNWGFVCVDVGENKFWLFVVGIGVFGVDEDNFGVVVWGCVVEFVFLLVVWLVGWDWYWIFCVVSEYILVG